MRLSLAQGLLLAWLVGACALRQREVARAPPADGQDGTGLFVPARTPHGEEGSTLGPAEKKSKAAGLPEGPVCTDRSPEPSPPGAVAAQRKAAAAAGEGSMSASLGKSLTSGSRADGGGSLNSDNAIELARAQSRELVEILNTTRAYVTMVQLCDHTHFLKEPGYYLVRALVMARSMTKVNSSYPLVAIIPDWQDCPLADEYAGQFFEDLNVKFVRMPHTVLDPEVLPDPLIAAWRWNYGKAYLFAMDAFERIVYLDPDAIFLHNADDLFDRPEPKKVHMNPMMLDCSLHPLEKNNFMATTNMMVIRPYVPDFNAIRYQYLTVRQQLGQTDSTMSMNKIFGEEERIVFLSPADLLYTECLQNFWCSVDRVRVLHLGDIGNYVINQRNWDDVQFELDHNWKPVFHKWAAYCHGKRVRKACNGHCEDLCLAKGKDWACTNC